MVLYRTSDTSPDLLCKIIFGLDFPPSEESLKSEFRSRTMKGEYRHPDRGGEHEKFIELKDAYEILLPYCNINSKQSFNPRTTNGTLISDLGKGLGSTTNGIECTTCIGQGHYSVTRIARTRLGSYTRCPECLGLGYGFRFRTGFNPDTSICSICRGTGIKDFIGVEVTEEQKCSTCKGIGELPISNPVLQRGAFSLGTKSHNPRKSKKVKVANPLFKYKEKV